MNKLLPTSSQTIQPLKNARDKRKKWIAFLAPHIIYHVWIRSQRWEFNFSSLQNCQFGIRWDLWFVQLLPYAVWKRPHVELDQAVSFFPICKSENEKGNSQKYFISSSFSITIFPFSTCGNYLIQPITFITMDQTLCCGPFSEPPGTGRISLSGHDGR